jgi:hypothetical protein
MCNRAFKLNLQRANEHQIPSEDVFGFRVASGLDHGPHGAFVAHGRGRGQTKVAICVRDNISID